MDFLGSSFQNGTIFVFQFLQTFQDRCNPLHTNGTGTPELLQGIQKLLVEVGSHLMVLLNLSLMGEVAGLRNPANERNQSYLRINKFSQTR